MRGLLILAVIAAVTPVGANARAAGVADPRRGLPGLERDAACPVVRAQGEMWSCEARTGAERILDLRRPAVGGPSGTLPDRGLLSPAAAPGVGEDVLCPLDGWDTACEAWTATYDHAAGHAAPTGNRGIDRVYGAAAHPDGSLVYVTGASYDQATGYDAATVAFDGTTGATVWVARHDGGGGAAVVGDAMSAIAVSPDGTKVFVTGAVDLGKPGAQGQMATVAYDAGTGALLWEQRQQLSAYDDYGFDIAAADDAVVVTGGFGDSSGFIEGDLVVLAHDPRDGTVLWMDTHDHGFGDAPLGVAVSEDGATVLTAASAYARPFPQQPSQFALRYLALAHDLRTGTRRWVSDFAGDGGVGTFAQPMGFVASSDGSTLYMTGASDDPKTSPVEVSLTTVAFSGEDGGRRWVSIRGTGSAGTAVAVSPDGATVYVAGAQGGSAADYVMTAQRADTGAQRWARTYAGPGADWESATSIVAGADGSRVHVTGVSVHSAGLLVRGDYTTLALAASNGAQQWVARWNTALTQTDLDFDPNVRLVASADGSRLFAAGSAIHEVGNPMNYYDYAVASYAP